MKKIVVLVLIVGVLMLGTFAVVEKVSEGGSFHEKKEFSHSREIKDYLHLGHGDYFSDGGHQGGGGDVPG